MHTRQEAEEGSPLPVPLTEGQGSRILLSWLSEDPEGMLCHLRLCPLPRATLHCSLCHHKGKATELASSPRLVVRR